MDHIGEGLYRLGARMPCQPSDLLLSAQDIEAALNERYEDVAPKETARRILAYSKAAGTWVGVSWKRFCQDIKAELKAWEEWNQVKDHNDQELQKIGRRIFWWKMWVACTLGLGAFLLQKPIPKLRQPPLPEPPESHLRAFPTCAEDGMWLLFADDFVRHIHYGSEDLYCPTQRFIQWLVYRQKQSREEPS